MADDKENILEKVTQGPATDIKEAINYFKKTHSGVILFILLSFFSAVISCSIIVIFSQFHDWFMYILYCIVASGVILLHLVRSGKRTKITGFLSLIFALFTIIYFVLIINDKIPAQKTLVDDKVVLRESINLFYIPVILFLLASVGLAVQYVFEIIRHHRKNFAN
jgi:hypothetical protein